MNSKFVVGAIVVIEATLFMMILRDYLYEDEVDRRFAGLVSRIEGLETNQRKAKEPAGDA